MINVVVSAQELAVPGDVADVDDGALDAHLGRGVGDLPEKMITVKWPTLRKRLFKFLVSLLGSFSYDKTGVET
jgi:hypothetical protein